MHVSELYGQCHCACETEQILQSIGKDHLAGQFTIPKPELPYAYNIYIYTHITYTRYYMVTCNFHIVAYVYTYFLVEGRGLYHGSPLTKKHTPSWCRWKTGASAKGLISMRWCHLQSHFLKWLWKIIQGISTMHLKIRIWHPQCFVIFGEVEPLERRWSFFEMVCGFGIVVTFILGYGTDMERKWQWSC